MNENKIAKDAFLISFTKVLNLIISLASSMLLARFRTLQEYGTYSQITTVVALATSIFMLGLPNSLNYFIARANDQEEKDHFLSLYYILVTILSAFTGVLLFLGRPLISSYYTNDLIDEFWYCLLLLPWAQTITAGVSNMMVATNNTNRLVVYNIARSLAFLLLLICVQIFNGNFYSYMVLYVVVDAVFTLIVYKEALRVMTKIYYKIDFRKIRAVLAFSIPMGLSAAISTLNIQLDHLMIGRFFDTESLAVYSNAAKELPFTIIATSFTAVLMPQMTRLFKQDKNEEAVTVWGRAIELNAIILFFCTMACIVFAPQMITILYSSKYIGGVPVFRIYAIALMLRVTYFGMVLNTTGNTKYVLYSSILSLIINVILNYALIRTLGMTGAALATIISLAVIGVAQLSASSKFIGVAFSKIFPWKRLLNITLINILIGAIAFAVLNIMKLETSTMDIVIAIGIGIVTFLIYALIMRKRFMSLTKGLSGK